MMKLLISILISLFVFTTCFAQENNYQWIVTSERISDKEYKLQIETNAKPGYVMYAPGQTLADYSTASIELGDSSIQIGNITTGNPVKQWKNPLFENQVTGIEEGSVSWTTTIRFNGPVPATLSGNLLYTYGNEEELYPSTFSFNVPLQGGITAENRIKIATIDIDHPVSSCGDEESADKSLFTLFLLGIGGGLIALITPCVFPMMPLTVSFFTKQAVSKRKSITNASLYALFIFLIYVGLSLPFHFIDHLNPEILNTISTNAYLNIAFFIIFIFFAFSFFGYYEITLPSGVVNKINPKANASTLVGILFMAFTLALVSFSCTGPILGSLLAGAISEQGGATELSMGMAGFGFGLAVPFALFSVFPHWLQSLPRSGGWLHTVKVVLGFLELALALKFLSNADLVKQWGLLKREVFIGLWMLIALAALLYLAGAFYFPHDARNKKPGKGKWITAGALFLMIVYLAQGLTNTHAAQLTTISGFPPPACYSVYKNPVNCKDHIQPLRDYEEALALSKKLGKPLLIDFTGWACVNCRRMEEKVWTDPQVAKMMKEKFVVVSLYVDERRKLPIAEQTIYKTTNGSVKNIRTVGDKWASFQSENFKAVSQPQYAILNTEEKALTKPKTYTPDPEEFRQWLECGLNAYKK